MAKYDDLKRKLADLNKAIRINPNDANAYQERADVFSELEDYQGAIEDYTQAIRINPNDANAYSMRSVQRRKLRDYKGAIEDWTKGIDLNLWDNAHGYLHRAELYYFQGECKEALVDSNTAIQLDPHCLSAYYLRGQIRNELGDYKGAIEDYNQELQVNSNGSWPARQDLYTCLGEARANLGDYQGAIEDFNKVFEIKGFYQFRDKTYNARGNVFYKLGDFNKAIEDYSQAIYITGGNKRSSYAIYYINRGYAYNELKSYQKAVEDYNNAIQIVQNYPDVYEYRGVARYHLGDKVGAIKDLKKAAALYQKGGWVEYYRDALNLIQSLSVPEKDTTVEEIYEIPETINNSLIGVKNIDNYAVKKQILKIPIEDNNQNNTQEIVENIDGNNLKEVKKLEGVQELIDADGLFSFKSIKEARERITVSIARRQGQPQFRQFLLEVYNYCCAITGCDAQEALEAAHIIPYSETENNHPSNGLLLRADLHTLFDLNLITINPETMQIHLAPSLRHTSYREIHGKSLQLPNISAYLPKKEALKWRCNQCKWYR